MEVEQNQSMRYRISCTLGYMDHKVIFIIGDQFATKYELWVYLRSIGVAGEVGMRRLYEYQDCIDLFEVRIPHLRHNINYIP